MSAAARVDTFTALTLLYWFHLHTQLHSLNTRKAYCSWFSFKFYLFSTFFFVSLALSHSLHYPLNTVNEGSRLDDTIFSIFTHILDVIGAVSQPN